MDLEFSIDSTVPLHDIAYFLSNKKTWTLRQIIEKLEVVYCRNIGYQFQHVPFPAEKKWLREYIEGDKGLHLNQKQ